MHKRLWTGLLILLLQGCSALKLGYNQAPQLAQWWLDGQLALQDQQSDQVREALLQLHRWHRDNELVAYADLLRRLQGLAERDIDAQQVCGVWSEVDDAMQRLVMQSIRLAAPIALQLTPGQLRHQLRHQEKKNEEWAKEWLEGDAQERIKRRLEKTVSRFSDFYGTLSTRQTELLRSQLEKSLWSAEWGRQERLRRQQALVQALQRLQRTHTTLAQAEAALTAVWQQWLAPTAEAERQLYKRWVSQSCANLAELHNSTSQEQRQRAVRRLRAYEKDLRELAGRS